MIDEAALVETILAQAAPTIRRIAAEEVHRAVTLPDELRGGLTRRQIQAIRLLAEGQTAKQIAQTMGCTEKTVRNHLTGAYRKLDADNGISAVIAALKRGLLD